MTITEALAEIKTIGKRLEAKRTFVRNYLARQERIKDPLDKDGGSVVAVKRERQGIRDLETRIIALRVAVQEANRATSLTVQGVSRTVAEWLTWRREVAPGAGAFLKTLSGQIAGIRKEAQQKGLQVVQGPNPSSLDDILIHVDEADLAKEIELHEQVLGELDGQLSLLNATVAVTV